ncbi:MAG: hypothetical protein QNK54_04985 [Candidatus Planktophila sp.]
MKDGSTQAIEVNQLLTSANYDEEKVGRFQLPDVLMCTDGTLVTSPELWIEKRRIEIFDLFAANIYGVAPQVENKILFKVNQVDVSSLGGRATRKEVSIFPLGKQDGPKIELQLFTPNNTQGQVPAFLGCNFFGNHAIIFDLTIAINKGWMRNSVDNSNVVNNQATESSRGSEAHRWQVEKIIDAGFALATFYYGDVEADHLDGWKDGIRGSFSSTGSTTSHLESDWGAIAAWAWGLSRAMDYLENESQINFKKIAVMGHSRLGKAALWAGACDERFALVISNNSGAGGASIARRNYGESISALNQVFPYWFCKKYASFSAAPETLPVDMHQLVALIAPRPLYIASAEEDRWADPKGEFLAGKYAAEVYSLFSREGVNVSDWPEVNTPVGEYIGYHVRSGVHDVTAYDWEQYIQFATRHLRDL